MGEQKVGRRSALRVGGMAAAGAVGAGAAAVALPQVAAAAGFGFTPVAPYRSLDTRAIPGLGKLAVGEHDEWDLWTDMFGNGRIPSDARAVAFNLTITETQVAGNLAMWPAGQGFPGVSTINWVVSGLDLANGGTVPLGFSSVSGPGSVIVGCSGMHGAATHYIIDVSGYYS